MQTAIRSIEQEQLPLRTTLLDLVTSLTRQGLEPDEVERNALDAIDDGRVELTGNFRDGLISDAAPKSREARLRAWMTAAQGGDELAYRRLLEELLPEVTRLVRAKLFDPGEVDDVVQNALLSIHRARHTYRPERPFGPWMRSIVRNATIDHLRRLRRRKEREVGSDDLERIADPSGSFDPEQHRLSPELAALLDELPAGQRQAIHLLQVQDLSIAEAAERVGITSGALRVRAHRGYRALRERLMASGVNAPFGDSVATG